ncbi:MAG TPA: undecaprenyl-diphosphate phosphatase [Opitutaceae bacterium]
MSLLAVLILAILQGAAELLPVSSSAHVILAEKLMHLDPASPQAMFVLAMLHTGTMFAVLIYFWTAWKRSYFSSGERFRSMALNVIVATAITGIVGYLGLVHYIEHHCLAAAPGATHGDIEELARNTPLLAGALGVAGLLIIVAGLSRRSSSEDSSSELQVSAPTAAWMGLAQAICLPFRGLSRSGTTISTGLLMGARRRAAEEFSFALVIVLTPAIIGREVLRLKQAFPDDWHNGTYGHLMMPGLLGLVFSFLAGLGALRWLSSWLEAGRWHYFGIYCVVLALAIVAFGPHTL